MNIYSKKQQWKLWLFIVALIIVGLSLWYTRTLVTKIAMEEQEKVHLWAEAIQKKARYVRQTEMFFQLLREEERKKIEIWRLATEKLINAPIDSKDDMELESAVSGMNSTVPVIIVDSGKHVLVQSNIDIPSGADSSNFVQEQIEVFQKTGSQLDIKIYQLDLKLYYTESKVITQLRQTFEDLQQSFINDVVSTATAPVIMTDNSLINVIQSANVDEQILNDPELLKEKLNSMMDDAEPLQVELGTDRKNFIFYEDSFLLTQLKYYPFAQFGVIGLFILIGYLLFSTARRVEQNQVWVGMSKETAHQLGTPLSSLMAWMELLKAKDIDPKLLAEMGKDVKRLEVITDRFSKIGSMPKLEEHNVGEVLKNAINYMQTRTSDKVQFTVNIGENSALLNVPLFEWVIENLCRNAIDAMSGKGSITVETEARGQQLIIDITDSGKGIPSSKQKTVFEPGYTTKKRGWGLGLSLTKRIIENYHNGKIFVKRSEVDKGTTFRIILNAS